MMDYLLLRLPLFSLSAIAVFLEAAPFLLLGSLIAGLVEIFVPAGKLERLAPRSPVMGTLFGLGLGTLLPTCECGVIPIVRRLLAKGLPPQTALAYMLAAPVLNPVVVAATYAAFRGDLWLTGGRMAVVALVAGAVGLSMAGVPARAILREDAPESACGCGHCHDHAPAAHPAVLLPAMSDVESADFNAFAAQAAAGTGSVAVGTQSAAWTGSVAVDGSRVGTARAATSGRAFAFGASSAKAAGAPGRNPLESEDDASLAAGRQSGSPLAASSPSPDGPLAAKAPDGSLGAGTHGGPLAARTPGGPPNGPQTPGLAQKLRAVAGHTLSDFMGSGVYLLLGCFAASAFKTFLPPETLSLVQDNLWLAVPTMMLLAVLLTICSEADAFVAASFVMMPGAAKLAFVALGPMVDLKLLAMYSAVFKRRATALLVIVPILLVWLLSMIFGLSLPAMGVSR